MASGNGNFPKVLVIIPDGNRRKANRIGLPSWRGHEEGFEIFKLVFDSVWDYGVEHFIFCALSYNNFLKRSKPEIQFLLRLFQQGLDEIEEKIKSDTRDIRFHAVGEWYENFPDALVKRIESLEEKTCDHKTRHFTLLLAYSGKRELFQTIERTCNKIVGNGQWEQFFMHYLPSGHIPDIDLYIRTGDEGDPHLSDGTLMIQMANAQLAFTKTLWPDFTLKEFDTIMQNYCKRERRLGA